MFSTVFNYLANTYLDSVNENQEEQVTQLTHSALKSNSSLPSKSSTKPTPKYSPFNWPDQIQNFCCLAAASADRHSMSILRPIQLHSLESRLMTTIIAIYFLQHKTA